MLANYLHTTHPLSKRRACRLVMLSSTSFYRRITTSLEDDEIKQALSELAARQKTWGCDKMIAYFKNKGQPWNHKRIHRLYKELGLNIRIKPKRRFNKTTPEYLSQPIYKNVCWSLDFMSDALDSGTKFRTLNVIDDYNREALRIIAAFSIPATMVTRTLDDVGKQHGYPCSIRIDNGPELIAKHFKQWAMQRHITLRYIQPGKPAQNGLIERFNRTYRQDVLDANLFSSLQAVQELTDQWVVDYNTIRPHEALGNRSPKQFEKYRSTIVQKMARFE